MRIFLIACFCICITFVARAEPTVITVTNQPPNATVVIHPDSMNTEIIFCKDFDYSKFKEIKIKVEQDSMNTDIIFCPKQNIKEFLEIKYKD